MDVFVLTTRENPHIEAGHVYGVYASYELAQAQIGKWCKQWKAYLEAIKDEDNPMPLPDIPADELCYIVQAVLKEI